MSYNVQPLRTNEEIQDFQFWLRRTSNPERDSFLFLFAIYSTNLIEGFNKQLKKYTKRKEQFPNEESLERFLVSQFNNYNQKFLCRVHKGFKEIHDTLESMF
ncbi:hypothetical protein EfmAA610_31980 (plasmid) [Enterococcus faecium]|nr:hypothetical protein EfmAA610_31980 [Enterococcus faecium]